MYCKGKGKDIYVTELLVAWLGSLIGPWDSNKYLPGPLGQLKVLNSDQDAPTISHLQYSISCRLHGLEHSLAHGTK